MGTLIHYNKVSPGSITPRKLKFRQGQGQRDVAKSLTPPEVALPLTTPKTPGSCQCEGQGQRDATESIQIRALELHFTNSITPQFFLRRRRQFPNPNLPTSLSPIQRGLPRPPSPLKSLIPILSDRVRTSKVPTFSKMGTPQPRT